MDDSVFFASRRSPIERTAKNNVHYDEDAGPAEVEDEYAEFHNDGNDTPATPEMPFRNGFRDDVVSQQEVTLINGTEVEAPQPRDSVLGENAMGEQRQPQQEITVIDLSQSDDEEETPTAGTLNSGSTPTPRPLVKPEPESESNVARPREYSYSSRRDESGSSTVANDSLTSNVMRDISRERSRLELKLRSARLQREELNLETALWELQG